MSRTRKLLALAALGLAGVALTGCHSYHVGYSSGYYGHHRSSYDYGYSYGSSHRSGHYGHKSHYGRRDYGHGRGHSRGWRDCD